MKNKKIINNDQILRFEITDKCNLRCNMCWSGNWKHQDMSLEQVKSILKSFKKNFNGTKVVFTSREPLLYVNFIEVLEFSKKLDLDIELLTNGILIDESIANSIIEHKISSLCISLHGEPDVHDSIVRKQGATVETIQGLKQLSCKKNNLNSILPSVSIVTVVSKNLYQSLDYVSEIASELASELRIQHLMWFSDNIKKVHKSYIKEKYMIDDTIIDGFPSEPNITGDEVIDILKTAKKICIEKNVSLQIYPELTEEQIRFWYNSDIYLFDNAYCEHSMKSSRVRADGTIPTCQYIDIIHGSLQNSDWETITNNKERSKIFNDLSNNNLLPICSRCCHLLRE